MKLTPVFAAMFLATACQATDETKDIPIEPPKDAGCGASNLQHLLGKNSSVLTGMTFEAERVRIIKPGMAITMDHLTSRLNITLDEDGTITRVYCG